MKEGKYNKLSILPTWHYCKGGHTIFIRLLRTQIHAHAHSKAAPASTTWLLFTIVILRLRLKVFFGLTAANSSSFPTWQERPIFIINGTRANSYVWYSRQDLIYRIYRIPGKNMILLPHYLFPSHSIYFCSILFSSLFSIFQYDITTFKQVDKFALRWWI